MTKKQFEALAAALAWNRPSDPYRRDIYDGAIRAVSAFCAAQNDRFDEERFLAAATRDIDIKRVVRVPV